MQHLYSNGHSKQWLSKRGVPQILLSVLKEVKNARQGHECCVTWTTVTVLWKPADVSAIPRRFLFKPAPIRLAENLSSSIFTQLEWKTLTPCALHPPVGIGLPLLEASLACVSQPGQWIPWHHMTQARHELKTVANALGLRVEKSFVSESRALFIALPLRFQQYIFCLLLETCNWVPFNQIWQEDLAGSTYFKPERCCWSFSEI